MYFREIPSEIDHASAPSFDYFGESPRPRQTVRPQCPTRFTRARNFRELIALVRAAEAKLAACGFTSVEQRIHVLRGIYYGTVWSTDYKVENSPARNLGFQVYTASTTPPDPRRCLDCGLFEALGQSQDIRDGARSVDFGHLMIGLDARRSVIGPHQADPHTGRNRSGHFDVAWRPGRRRGDALGAASHRPGHASRRRVQRIGFRRLDQSGRRRGGASGGP
jgi:hypothetical protein